MLVLTRKAGEKLMIGDNVVMTVLAVRGDAVRLGIEAPAEVPIHREEVRRQIGWECAAPQPPRPSQESPFFVEFA